jgi:uncharacterized membrane protein
MIWIVLVAFTAAFIGLHLLPFAPARRARLVTALGGEQRYKGAYAVASLVALIGAFVAAGRAPVVDLWTAGAGLRWLALLLTLPAFVLLASAYVGGRGRCLARHPMLAGIGLWALAHVAAVGTLAHLAVFGALAVYAPVAMVASDRRLADRDPAAHAASMRETSLVPFARFGSGGAQAGLRGPGALVGLGTWLAFLLLHPWLFGVSPLPPGLL